jgi:hypothetical protein
MEGGIMSAVWFGILLAGVMTSGCSRVTSTDDDGAATDQDGGVGTAGAAGRPQCCILFRVCNDLLTA